MGSKRNDKTSKSTPVAAPSKAPAQPAAAPTRAAQGRDMKLEWKARQDGSGEIVVVYAGALASKDAVLARAGTWRSGGQPWADVQDVRLTRDAPGRYVGAIPVRPGAPLEAVELAFHAGDDWDNGGRAPLGYYEWSLREQQLVVR
jgi:hypothetical protein